ncbi:MAG: UDP-N-acetylmuramoyl-L-alanine--D-glutamate ligase [Mariprofundus sp.]|nr:UDP-N-acetylmuramoyl-L-alanine--D-glutamate ligase [Mariprofundus sp.]
MDYLHIIGAGGALHLENPMNMPRQKKCAVIGMGVTGQSIVRFLQAAGIRCEAFDESAVALAPDLSVAMHIGTLDGKKLLTFDEIIVSPGVNYHHPALVAARAAGIPVYGDLDLFAAKFSGELLAVTGTNGKTTTVSLIETMLDILPGGIVAAGNIGKPMLSLLADDAQPFKRVVLELSSFQLERAEHIHPHWAILLNLQPDHADMHLDMAAYGAAKVRLFDHQGDGDRALLPADQQWNTLAAALAERGVSVRRFGFASSAQVVCGVELLANGDKQLFWHHGDRLQRLDSKQILVKGEHQYLNLAIAAQAAADYAITASVIKQSLSSFRGLPHRLHSLGMVQAREWYNDSKATNPDAAGAALNAFDKVIWICGGLRKELDLLVLKDTVAAHVALMLVTGRDTAPFITLAKLAGVPVSAVGSIEKGVKKAAAGVAKLPVLLSPAAASQDQFANYAERGNCFAAAVAALDVKE